MPVIIPERRTTTLLNAVIYSGNRSALGKLREHFKESAEMVELWDWFDLAITSAARNRELLKAIDPETIEPVPTPQGCLKLGYALTELFHALKIGVIHFDVNHFQDVHHHTSILLPTDCKDDKETVERFIAILNRRFPRIEGDWDIIPPQNWPKGSPLEKVARSIGYVCIAPNPRDDIAISECIGP